MNIWRIETRFGLDQEIRLKKIREAKKKIPKGNKEKEKSFRRSREKSFFYSSTSCSLAGNPDRRDSERRKLGKF